MSTRASTPPHWRRYPTYKPTGSDRTRVSPDGWTALRLGRILRVRSGDFLDLGREADSGVPVFGGNGQRGYTDRANTRGPVILVGRVGALCGNVHLVHHDVWATEHAFRVYPLKSFHLGFLAYLLQDLDLRRFATSTAQPLINTATVHSQLVALPTTAEQRTIAAFLDAKTAEIDALIEKKERLIELLEEKRAAVIARAVTKGLDTSVPMKRSGAPYLGEIPGHWDIVRLRRVGHVDQGNAFAHDIQGQEAGHFPWFKVADMNRRGNEIEMISAENLVDRDVARNARATVFPAGAVIFPRVGAALLTNKRRVLTQPSIIDDNTYAVVPRPRIRSRFLYLSLLLVDMASICSAGLVPTVTFSAIKDLALALPPGAEQDRIVEYVEAECRTLDDLAARYLLSIDRLREYRTALISAAVTGKIDVRSYQTTPCP